MNLLAEQTAEIDCPVSVAYEYASNLERFGEWFPGVIAIESANDRAHASLGKEYLETVEVPLRGVRRVKITVKEAEPEKLLITEGSLVPLLPRMELRFRHTGPNSCHLTWRMYSRSISLLARLTIIPLAKGILAKRAAVGVARLKKNLEGKR